MVLEYIDKISAILNSKSWDVLGFKDYAPALYIIIAVSALIVIGFIITAIISANSKVKKYRRNTEDVTAFINQLGVIDEQNVDQLNAKIQQLPDPVVKGWGNFLSQQTGYPSDYVTEKDVLHDGVADSKRKAGKTFFNVFSWIVIFIGIAATAISYLDTIKTLASGGELTSTVSTSIFFSLAVLGTIVAPLILYVIFIASIGSIYKKQSKKYRVAFLALQDALDNNVLIFREEQDEFISENIEEINTNIEEILANRLNDTEVLEIVTTPAVEAPIEELPEIEEVASIEEEPVVEVPVEEPAKEEVVAMVDPEVEREERLVTLVNIAVQASHDPDMSYQEISDLANVIADAKNGKDYTSQAEQDIFAQCLVILANSPAYTGKK